MKERDCANCIHHTSDGCSSWDCEFEAKDLINRADAIEEISKGVWNVHELIDRLKALPSAEAKPTVIRSKTLLPTKDFKEWAKRVRETNPNVIVIPCDAEVVSADAVEVVRCKDCKYRGIIDYPVCCESTDEWFCADGERKGGDTE